MKTPEQISKDVLAATHGFPTYPSGPDLRALMARAIEADRAQRQIASFDTLDTMLAAWEEYDGDVDGFIQAWSDYLTSGDELPEWAKTGQVES